MAIKVLPTSAVRGSLPQILADLARDGGPCILTRNGRAVGALLSIDAYNQVLDDLEDRMDERDPQLIREVREAERQMKRGLGKRIEDIR